MKDQWKIQIFQCIDLTQLFNGNIPQDLLDNPEHWSWYQTYGDYIPYNTGALISGNGQYLVCGGRNLFNKEDYGVGYINASGEVVEGYNLQHSNYIKVNPNTKYIIKQTNSNWGYAIYDKNKVFVEYHTTTYNSGIVDVPSNGWFIRITMNIPTLQTQVFSLYYAGEDYSQYYPYEQPKVYDTGSEELLSTGVKLSVSGERQDIYDYKEPNGLITRRVGKYTFTGSESWSVGGQISSGLYRYYYTRNEMATGTAMSGICDKLPTDKGTYNAETIPCIRFGQNNHTIYVYLTENLDASGIANYMKNKVVIYPLATSTTEQGTPYSENIEINDFGTMGWYSAYIDSNTNTLVSVPQGCKIFYPAWYVGFIDTLGQRADIDWNANNVVSQTELDVVDTKHDNLYAIMQENVGGSLRHQLSASASIDFLNTKWVDLGSLNWVYTAVSSSYPYGYFSSTDLSNYSGSLKVICPKYKTVVGLTVASAIDGSITGHGSVNKIFIIDSSYTNATTFKNAMKGVLLAYEKAS